MNGNFSLELLKKNKDFDANVDNVISSYKKLFEVEKNATKIEIAQAVELAFPGRKVKKVQTVYMPSHEKRMGLKFGRTDSSKKAIVTVEGEPIEELTAI